MQHSSLLTCELEREVSLPLHLLLVPLVSAEEKHEEDEQQPSSNLSCLLIPRGACLCRYTTGQPGRHCASFLGLCCSQHSKISPPLTAGAFIRGVYVLLMDLSRAYPGRSFTLLGFTSALTYLWLLQGVRVPRSDSDSGHYIEVRYRILVCTLYIRR